LLVALDMVNSWPGVPVTVTWLPPLALSSTAVAPRLVQALIACCRYLAWLKLLEALLTFALRAGPVLSVQLEAEVVSVRVNTFDPTVIVIELASVHLSENVPTIEGPVAFVVNVNVWGFAPLGMLVMLIESVLFGGRAVKVPVCDAAVGLLAVKVTGPTVTVGLPLAMVSTNVPWPDAKEFVAVKTMPPIVT
jgi:hypothetical protein